VYRPIDSNTWPYTLLDPHLRFPVGVVVNYSDDDVVVTYSDDDA